MHAEKCPICDGKGRTVIENTATTGGITIPPTEPCHGCNGKGWVEVSDEPQEPYVWKPETKTG